MRTLVLVNENSDWKSTNLISKNIKDILVSYFAEVEIVDVNSFLEQEDIDNLVDKILNNKIEHVFFATMLPLPGEILNSLYVKYFLKRKEYVLPKVSICLYGNFIFEARNWFGAENILKKFKINLFVLGQTQKKLLSKFISHRINIISLFPNRDSYKNDSKSSMKTEFTFLYCGRLSYQKNIITLLKCFERVRDDNNCKLVLCGEYDDIVSPIHGLLQSEISYKTRVRDVFESLSSDVQNSIEFMGNINYCELHKQYENADCYISLSTHHDEDFAYAAQDAIFYDLDFILTHWGAHKDIIESASSGKAVSVSFDKDYPTINMDEVILKMNDSIKVKSSNNINKNVKQAKFHEGFDYFDGFLPLMRELYLEFKKNDPYFFLGDNDQISSLYQKIYAGIYN